MVISSNPEPQKEAFRSLLNQTIAHLREESKRRPGTYLQLLGTKLESVVATVMIEKARNTPFDGSIELISGQKFPDIIAKRYYGVEVKTTKLDHWTTTGNSVLESTRVEGIQRIYMLFGKMVNPIEFKCRPYEDCLSDVVVTHSPRYLIDMDLAAGNTVFDKLNLSYDTLRNLPNPIRPVIEYYRRLLKPGEELWWMDQEEPKPTSIVIKLWNNLPVSEREDYMVKSMILFPEIFGSRPDKFNGVAVWLVNMEGVVCPNIRDVFTAGGRGSIEWNGFVHEVPKMIVKLSRSIEHLKVMMKEIDKNVLENYWQVPVNNKINGWLTLVEKNLINKTTFDLIGYLKSRFRERTGSIQGNWRSRDRGISRGS